MGGAEGFGPVDPTDDGAPFHADWEARVHALQGALLRNGVFGPDEFRDAIERIEPARYLELSYYERWLAATEDLLARKGVLDPARIEVGDG